MALAFFLLTWGVLPAWKEVHSDFANYYVAANLVIEEGSLDKIYDNDWFREKIREHGLTTNGKFAPFPPVTAWMMIPLAHFEPITAQRIFLFINLTFILIGAWLLKEITYLNFRHSAMLILGGGLSVVNNIAFGQAYLIMTVFILLSFLLVRYKYSVIAGCLLGVSASLKYLPIVFIAGYFLNEFREKRFNSGILKSPFSSDMKVFFSSLMTILFIVCAEFLFFGTVVMNEFISSVLIPHLDGQLTGQGLYTFHFQSWDNLFRNLFIKSNEFNPSPLIDWPNGKTIMKIIVSLIVIGCSAIVLYNYRDKNKRIAVYLTVLSLSAFVLLPATATYHFALLLIPLALIIGNQLMNRNLVTISIIIYAMIGFIPYGIFFQLGKSWGLYFGYPRLWLICALYITVLYGLNKKNESLV